MNNVHNYILDNNLIKQHDVVGVACSGGLDSMVLLHYLKTLTTQIGFEIVAINLNHCIRKDSQQDSQFVIDYARSHNIKCFYEKVDVPALCNNEKLSIEDGARKARYSFFNNLLKEGKVTKIALGHHLYDQAETILLHLFRGTGLNGASGMRPLNGDFIRPLLATPLDDIANYAKKHNVSFVVDKSNYENTYSRNLIRNKIMPIVRKRWPNADTAVFNFGEVCNTDNNYLTTLAKPYLTVVNPHTVQVPVDVLNKNDSISLRVILLALQSINIWQGIGKSHLQSVIYLSQYSQNGTQIHLPNNLIAIKEYEHITLTRATKNKTTTTDLNTNHPFVLDTIYFNNFGTIKVTATNDKNGFDHIINGDSLPKELVWRYRKTGDMIEKFGGGSKLLKDYFIDKKIPRRLRDQIPVLAAKNEIYVIAGVEISNKLKVTSDTKKIYGIEINKK